MLAQIFYVHVLSLSLLAVELPQRDPLVGIPANIATGSNTRQGPETLDRQLAAHQNQQHG